MFKDWLILTEMTASQFLKRPENASYVNQVKNWVTSFVSDSIHGNPNLISRYTNWFIKELIRRQIPIQQVIPSLDNMWANIGDFIVANQNQNQVQGKFNTMEYTYESAIADSEHWHLNMRANDSAKGAEGRVVVNLDDLPGFQGWNWVALDRPSCGKEGDAMGHCGNAGGKGNLLSLRDPNGFPHLTFINHRGTLGEMKGKGNSKPQPRYHLPIVKLLLSNEIGSIEGGGYAPQNNFEFSDLSPELQQQVKARKPYIDQPELFAKKKEKIIQGLNQKARNQTIGQTTPENVGDAVRSLVNRSYQPADRIYDTDMMDDMPEHIHNNNIWKMYSELLNSIYIRAKHSHPQDLFVWMDRMIEAFVGELIAKDQQKWDQSPQNHQFFPHLSNIVKLDEMVYRLAHEQPEILKAAPKRSRFTSWDQYIQALKRFLDMQGYDLPSYRPDNHMISYEFNQKMAEEVVKQGKGLVALVQQAHNETDPRFRHLQMMRQQFTRDNPKDFFYGNEPRRRKPEPDDDW